MSYMMIDLAGNTVKSSKVLLMKKAAVMLTAIILCLHTSVSIAQAYCSLRDPVSSIRELFPEADNFRSVVRVVDQSVREKVSRELPPNTLHFGELGRHTLYVALKNNIPLGYVHSRSEQSQWGLIEVAWALDLSLNIIDFHLQRCRSTYCKTLETGDFRKTLQHRSYTELKQLLAQDNFSIDTSQVNLPAKSESLASAILRCGIKTALITEFVWEKELVKAQMQARARQVFRDAADIQLVVDIAQQVPIQQTSLSGNNAGIAFEQAQLAKAFDADGKFLGAVFSAPHYIAGKNQPVWWAIDSNASITNVVNDWGWPTEEVKQIFQSTIGKSFSSTQQCANQVELMALEATQAVVATMHK